jgi:hypothetical protein
MGASLARVFGVLAVLCVVVLPARADPNEERAHELFGSGRAHYQAGHYREALRDFEAGYALVPRPTFLLNMGQAYRQLLDVVHAREKYVAFLAKAPVDDPARPQVEELLREIDRSTALAVATAAPPPPKRSFVRRHWWIFPTTAVVLAGVGVGIYFAVRPPSRPGCGDVSLGCLDPVAHP